MPDGAMPEGAPNENGGALRRPPALAPGARVALVSPAGPLRDDADVARAVENARALGWEPTVGEHALARRGYFAGDDASRLADLNRALGDDRVDGVWCLRGGYGAMRLLPALDYDALRRRPKPLLGYSDITALHAAAGRRAGVATFHGPTARAELTPFSRASLARALARDGEPCGAAPAARTLRPGRARGVLAGGNLALLAALTGTPFAPRLEGAILVLEDVNEAVYRVDRMLRQLLLAGALDGVRAIAFGECTECPAESDDGARTLDEVVAEVADALAVPCVAGIPVGHIADQWTVPLGAMAELDAEGKSLCVEG
jgi:muramoyltetrapeptide carboxypeptidase